MQFRASLVPLEAAFLSRSLSRLFDPVNLMFDATSRPTRQECDSLIRTITSEINVSSVDDELCKKVARNILKCIRLIQTRCEALLPASYQVIGPVTEEQSMVVSVVNQLFYLRSQLERTICGNLSHLSLCPEAQNIIDKLEPTLVEVIQAFLSRVFDAIVAAVAEILLTMHNENFGVGSVSAQCSLYMRELQTFLTRAAESYIAPFSRTTLLVTNCSNTARKCLSLFILNASLLRPLEDGGKQRLAADFAMMESVITNLSSKTSDLGMEYRQLRAVKPLLFVTAEHMAKTSSLGDIIPHSLLLHFLFSRAPPDLKSPHESAGWTIAQYVKWWTEHPREKDRRSIISGSLESYVCYVRRSGLSHYCDVYPIMQNVLEQATG